MKTRSFLGWATGIGTAAAIVQVSRSYNKWKHEQRERLRMGSRLLETARGTIEYRLEGDGPVVMILHGSPGGYDQGIALSRLLDLQGFSVLALSRPGYRRTPLASGVTPQAQADLFAAALDALTIPQAIVIGQSGGGPSAIQFALRHPERCRALLLISAVAQRYSEEEVYRGLPPMQSLLKRLLDQLIVFDPLLFLLIDVNNVVFHEEKANALLSSLAMNNLRTQGYRNDMRQFADISHYPIQDILAPTLILHGTNDSDIPFSQAQAMANRLPGARLVTIEGAGHFFVLQSKKAVEAIREFLLDPAPHA